MGNCFPKKKNRVSPAPAEDVSDMEKALSLGEDDGPEDQLTPEATQKLAMAFTVDLDTNTKAKPKPGMPKRLAERLVAEKESKSEFEYTNEEECLMADIMREARMKEVKERGVQEEIKVYDAKMKRLALEKSREAQLQERVRSSTPVVVSEARQRVKELAEADRKKAADRRKDSLKE